VRGHRDVTRKSRVLGRLLDSARNSPRPDRTARAAIARHLPLALLAGIVLALALAPHDAAPGGRIVGAAILIGFAIFSWAFGLFAEPVTSLVFFLLAVIFHVASAPVVFSGFASPAWWLVFGGAITAAAVQSTGLGRRLAVIAFGRVGGSYSRCVAAVAVATVGLAFLMPSTNGRILLLMPIVLAFADRLGLQPGRIGYTGLIVTVAAASYMPSTAILPANVPNSILLGTAETLYGVKLTYGPYLLLHFPILGALKTAILVWLVCRLFPEREPLTNRRDGALGPMSREERRLAIVVGASLLLFATDFLHGISPAWISLGTGILCLMPPIGVISPRVFSERVNIVTLIYIAGILGLGAIVADSGLGTAASEALLRLTNLTPGHPAENLTILGAIGAALALLTTVTGVPAVLTPLAGEFAAASGLPLLSVLMLQVVVFSTVLLPFESPPMMIALQLGGVGVRPATRLTLTLAAITLVVLLPLDYFWWGLLGYLP
jgi:di/tricarboxylate transporter